MNPFVCWWFFFFFGNDKYNKEKDKHKLNGCLVHRHLIRYGQIFSLTLMLSTYYLLAFLRDRHPLSTYLAFSFSFFSFKKDDCFFFLILNLYTIF